LVDSEKMVHHRRCCHARGQCYVCILQSIGLHTGEHTTLQAAFKPLTPFCLMLMVLVSEHLRRSPRLRRSSRPGHHPLPPRLLRWPSHFRTAFRVLRSKIHLLHHVSVLHCFQLSLRICSQFRRPSCRSFHHRHFRQLRACQRSWRASRYLESRSEG